MILLLILIIIAKPWHGIHHHHGASDHCGIFSFLKNLPELWSTEWSHSWKKFHLQNFFKQKVFPLVISKLWSFINPAYKQISFQSLQQNSKFHFLDEHVQRTTDQIFYTSEANQCQLSIRNLPFWLFVTAKRNIFIPVNFLRSQSNTSCSKTSLKLPYSHCVLSTKTWITINILCYFILLLLQWKKMLNQSNFLKMLYLIFHLQRHCNYYFESSRIKICIIHLILWLSFYDFIINTLKYILVL